MSTATISRRGSGARQRLLETARALFYAEGLHAVGVDRIIAEAGVAKATFYHHFGSKDDLICAYLAEVHDQQVDAVGALFAATGSSSGPSSEGGLAADLAAARIRAFFDALVEVACGPGFRGCAFVNAAAEFPEAGHPVRRVVEEHRHWLIRLFRDQLEAAGHPGAEATARLLVVLRDGLVVTADLDDAPAVSDLTHDAVARILAGPPA